MKKKIGGKLKKTIVQLVFIQFLGLASSQIHGLIMVTAKPSFRVPNQIILIHHTILGTIYL